MTAAVLLGPQSLVLREQPLPEPPAGALRVRLQGCGLCGSNLPVWEGRPWFQYPLTPGAPGHEAWGIVEKVGRGLEGWGEGDRVALLSYHAFAEYDTAPAPHVVRLPDALRDQPFPGEALGCAVNVFSRSQIAAGQTVAVVGIGFLGAVVVGLAARAGARVLAFSRRPYALEVARQMGAARTFELDGESSFAEQVRAETGGEGCERVIEATGYQRGLDVATELIREGGRLVIAGYHQDGLRTINMQLWNWRGIDVINAHERNPQTYIRGIQAAIRAVAEGRLNPAPLYTHRFSLEHLGEGFESMRSRPDRFLKALITYD